MTKFYMSLFYDFVVKPVPYKTIYYYERNTILTSWKHDKNTKIRFSLNILQYDITDIKGLNA